MASVDAYRKPRWLRDLQRFLPLKSQFVLTGNVRDLQAIESAPGQIAAVTLMTALATELVAAGYEHVVSYEPTGGFRIAEPLSGTSADGDALLPIISPDDHKPSLPSGRRDPHAETLEHSIPRIQALRALCLEMFD